jgi:hypothetical protein
MNWVVLDPLAISRVYMSSVTGQQDGQILFHLDTRFLSQFFLFPAKIWSGIED